ncbi:ABC transporter ATP-binding protein [Sporosarcina contaminans]|uniref:ABC transporter ATP-binding protein n=1 Tax=Sporosarcina contaminans TaxID=633403 RepID=A0ABW3TVH8_9BACL
MSLLRVENLTYKYPGVEKAALDGISFTVNKGEFIGIAGQNTAGKTTLCYAISGLVPHFFKGCYGGNVYVDGMDVLSHDISDITAKVGLVFENPFSQMTGAKFTVYDEIAFGLENSGVSRKEMHERIQESMKLLDIESLKEQNPFALSGGQLQRVAIASVIAMRPDILLLDEPTSQLDPHGAEEVFKVVESLTAQGMTILMAEQKMEKLAAYSDRILLLHEGKLIQDGSPAQVFSRDDITAYGVEPPVYSKVARKMDLRNTVNRLYPISATDIKTVGLQNVQIIEQKTANPSSAEHTPKILINGLKFGYDKKNQIFTELNMSLSGKPIAIIGQNGAGKTTFVKLLKALLRPDAGTIHIDGVDTSTTSAAKLASSIGLIFQNPNDQIFKNKVIDEVMFGPLNIGMPKEKAFEKAKEMLELVGLFNKAELNPYDLSLADRKMIALASVLAMDTKIVLFDEPTMGQDYAGKMKIKEIIHSLYQQGKLVICILHDMDFVANAFEQTIIMSDGEILYEGPTRKAFAQKEVLQKAKVEQPYITRLMQDLGYEGIVLSEEEIHVLQHRNF